MIFFFNDLIGHNVEKQGQISCKACRIWGRQLERKAITRCLNSVERRRDREKGLCAY